MPCLYYIPTVWGKKPLETRAFVGHAESMNWSLSSALFFLIGFSAQAASSSVEPARWRGFNLLNLFHKDWSNFAFEEEEFRWIKEWGFNFIRLPMDYRIWIEDGDWEKISESALKRVDLAVTWAQKYDLHLCLNFHRAPGYTVNHPPEAVSIWTDQKAQNVCAKHWRIFAERYRGVPPENLSFNLFNEPSGVSAEVHRNVVLKLAKVIWEKDPRRPIVVDGLEFGRRPPFDLEDQPFIFATRGYEPFALTHYRAPWVSGSAAFPEPRWPMFSIPAYLYGPDKANWNHPWRMRGNFPEGTRLVLKVHTVSRLAELRLMEGEKTLWEHRFQPGPGEGEWKESRFKSEWNIYQNVYDRPYTVTLKEAHRDLAWKITEGDWLTWTALEIQVPGEKPTRLFASDWTWGKYPSESVWSLEKGWSFFGEGKFDGKRLYEETIRPWERLVPRVLVGEFGAYRTVPHAVVLAWMRDCLENWKKAGFGWALWNLKGDFGVLDSNRPDVPYVPFHGRLLDREMLELLQAYL